MAEVEVAPDHYGDLLREQRELARGAALAPRPGRIVIEVGGSDRLTWLHSITSQDLTGLAAGESTELLVLGVNGHVEYAAAVLEDGMSTWLIVDRAGAPGLLRWLSMMRFRADVSVTQREDLAVVGYLRGGAAEQVVTAAAATGNGVSLIWNDPWIQVARGGWQYAGVADHPGADFRWSEALVPDAVEHSLDTPRAGENAVTALRIEAWRPSWASEVDERTLPHELDWLRSAVHLNKGCYRGQETVAKVHNLGHPPRRLVMLHLDGSDDVFPSPGDFLSVARSSEPVGRVTSVARHFELGPIALGVVSRRTPADVELVVHVGESRIAAGVEVIVPAEAGATADVPRLPRLSRRRAAPTT